MWNVFKVLRLQNNFNFFWVDKKVKEIAKTKRMTRRTREKRKELKSHLVAGNGEFKKFTNFDGKKILESSEPRPMKMCVKQGNVCASFQTICQSKTASEWIARCEVLRPRTRSNQVTVRLTSKENTSWFDILQNKEKNRNETLNQATRTKYVEEEIWCWETPSDVFSKCDMILTILSASWLSFYLHLFQSLCVHQSGPCLSILCLISRPDLETLLFVRQYLRDNLPF